MSACKVSPLYGGGLLSVALYGGGSVRVNDKKGSVNRDVGGSVIS